MVDSTQLAESKSIHRETGKTFYYATRLLPERVRHPTYVLYAFFRVADEVVDDPDGSSPAEQHEQLIEIRDAALGREPTDDPVLAAFSEVRDRYGIPDEEIVQFIDAMRTDIEKSRYETYDELEAYMRGSAAAVGVMMTIIMDADDADSAIPKARRLGEAFQLTNFLRDVGEDIADRDRIYLPEATLEACGAAPADIERRRFTAEIGAAVEREMKRAEGLYREGVSGIKYLPVDCQLPVLTAAILYADHHRLIRQLDYDTITETPSIGTVRKLVLVAKTRWYWAWNKDPEAVFAKVSEIPMVEDGPTPRSHPDDPLPMG
ncbi:MAG: phytoene/squalene synthase family protein [Natronomonas sp.]|jgi:phytoene synthase|uniref:phytoene/squalene synthase family protein n=1 Tax=Natronomonas sp. TaxID=2184060 RepID=UPI002870200E|nr:phytoene/squalene synthase family protein [Natronomonas sp.]MDR9381257.1 phytoene/squalene synthase family protein [Natronomonas sp.]MDR9429655.1 phytoene/squalene synthase family protein [Natronomonas sp.]